MARQTPGSPVPQYTVAVFHDEVTAERIRERLQRLVPQQLDGLWETFDDAADPDMALLNLDRWLASTSNPHTHLAYLAEHPAVAGKVLSLLGSAQPLADLLIQNPELADLIGERATPPTREAITSEGRLLLEHATSYSHRLDRLRYLKNRWTLPVVLHDLGGEWPQRQVWEAISTIADAVLDLTCEVVWNEFAAGKEMPSQCPVLVVAFGKLGGAELNYSSDIDLVYVADEAVLSSYDRDLARFCEMLGRALTDRMGRGDLYRVDLRLRPFGAAGSLVASMRGVAAYYHLHAEPWEVQALIRSRPICGPTHLADAWLEVWTSTCFGRKLSEATLDEILSMRTRVEERASTTDIKRGAGGIRDVEFLVQVLQLVHGYHEPEVRRRATLDALATLEQIGGIMPEDGALLAAGYEFLRKLEHRCQLIEHQQTHELPRDPSARHRIARLMGFEGWPPLKEEIARVRARLRSAYERYIETHRSSERSVLAAIGPLAEPVRAWFDAMPERSSFYEILAENRSSLDRVLRLVLHAPALLEPLRQSVSVTEGIISGEVEEEDDPGRRIEELPLNAPLEVVGNAYRGARLRVLCRWSLSPTFGLGPELARLMDALLRHICRRLHAGFDLVALGSYALGQLAPDSDADVLLLVDHQAAHDQAEADAQGMLSVLQALRRFDASIGVDLRLRPEGGKGLLVRTYEGLKTYELEAMEMWERFALGQCRHVHGRHEAGDVVMRCAYALPLTPERLRDLVAMKRRVETERVLPQHWKRDVKLGYGGLSDIEWFVHLHEMRFPTATKPALGKPLDERIESLARARLINAVEAEELHAGLQHLLTIRNRLHLTHLDADKPDDVIPENPNKLDRLAATEGFTDGNAFLQHHERVIETVRAVYTEGLERLKA